MEGGGRTWRTWQLAVVAAIALAVGITAGAGTKTKTVSAGSSATTSAIVVSTVAPVTAATTPRTTPPTTVPPTAAPTTAAGPKTTFAGEGTYIVGKDIAAGTYRTAGPKTGGSLASCYWERDSDLSGGFGGIIANDNLKGPGVVTIATSDKGFKTSGCQEWSQA